MKNVNLNLAINSKFAPNSQAEILTNAYIARVVADGGTVIDQAKVLADFQTLLDNNLYSNLVLAEAAKYGLKKDGSGNISVLYNLTNANDSTQGTLANQPNYNTSPDRITPNGTTDYFSGGNPAAFQITSAITVIVISKAVTEIPESIRVLLRKGSTTNGRSFTIQQQASVSDTVSVAVSANGVGVNVKDYRWTVTNWRTAYKSLAFTFSANTLKVYEDYVENTSPTNAYDGTVNSLYNTTDPLGLLCMLTGTTPSLYADHLVKAVYVFNKALSNAEMTAISTLGV